MVSIRPGGLSGRLSGALVGSEGAAAPEVSPRSFSWSEGILIRPGGRDARGTDAPGVAGCVAFPRALPGLWSQSSGRLSQQDPLLLQAHGARQFKDLLAGGGPNHQVGHCYAEGICKTCEDVETRYYQPALQFAEVPFPKLAHGGQFLKRHCCFQPEHLDPLPQHKCRLVRDAAMSLRRLAGVWPHHRPLTLSTPCETLVREPELLSPER